jgi:hypothetical protein
MWTLLAGKPATSRQTQSKYLISHRAVIARRKHLAACNVLPAERRKRDNLCRNCSAKSAEITRLLRLVKCVFDIGHANEAIAILGSGKPGAAAMEAERAWKLEIGNQDRGIGVVEHGPLSDQEQSAPS